MRQRGEGGERRAPPACAIGVRLAPYGSNPEILRPIAHEDQRRRPKTTTAAPATTSAAVRQPRRSTSCASSGRNTSCPVAFAAESAPSTSAAPRVEPARGDDRGEHHRGDARAGADAARPRAASSATGCCICVVSATETASSATAPATRRRSPQRSIADAANGPISPNSAMLMATAAEMTARLQPNSCFERDHQEARRRADAGRDEQDHEGHERDDPRVVNARSGGRFDHGVSRHAENLS